MKRVVFITVAFLSLSLGAPALASSRVQPVNNGIAQKVIQWIYTDPELQQNVTNDAKAEAAQSANQMSTLILRAIRNTGIANDRYISDDEVRMLNDYMYQHHHQAMVRYHGDDEHGIETGFHRVVNNGATSIWRIPVKRGYKKVNRAADGLFHLGLHKTVNHKKILNEDGNKNVRWRLISKTLYFLLKEDLHLNGAGRNRRRNRRR